MQRRPPHSTGFLTAAPPRVFAHRGLAAGAPEDAAPENTLLAFARASAAGATYIETDVHASSDGVAMISHDPDLARTAGRDSRVSDLTAAQLGAIQLGAGQTFTTLAAALDGFPQLRFNIDVKSADAVEPTVKAILAARATSRVLVTSFSEHRRAAAVHALPGVATSASASVFATALAAAKLGLSGAVRAALRSVDAVQIPERANGISTLSPRLLRLFHSAGVEVHVWTVNDVADMTRLLDLGVDGLITDRSDLAVELVQGRI